MLKEKMLKIVKESEGIKLFVLNDILDYGDEDEDIKWYIENVLNYGCVSGVVNSLTYYYQTKNFFQKYFEEILEVAEEVKEEYGINNIDLNYNSLSWLAYEEIVQRIAIELDLDI